MINKKVFIIWIFCSIILTAGIHYLDGLPEIDDWSSVSVGVFAGIVLLLIASILLSLIIAAIPVKAKKSISVQRVRVFMPFSLVFLTILALVAFVLTRPSYSSSAPADAGLCKAIQTGIFLIDEYVIERRGNIQTETDKTTNETTTFKVEWISDCEYKLINMADSDDTARVKITEVKENAYKCVAHSGERITEHELRIKRNGN